MKQSNFIVIFMMSAILLIAPDPFDSNFSYQELRDDSRLEQDLCDHCLRNASDYCVDSEIYKEIQFSKFPCDDPVTQICYQDCDLQLLELYLKDCVCSICEFECEATCGYYEEY